MKIIFEQEVIQLISEIENTMEEKPVLVNNKNEDSLIFRFVFKK